MSAWIFLSYRREDAAAEARGIRDALRQAFGKHAVFMDTSSIEAGALWPQGLRDAIGSAEVVLVVIGPEWLRVGSDEWGLRRIDQEQDWVRQELTLAFSQSKKVIPVLVRGAKMPPAHVLPEPVRALTERQAIELRRDYMDHDIKLLLAQLSEEGNQSGVHDLKRGPYPTRFPEGPDPVSGEKLQAILNTELTRWRKVVSPLPEQPDQVRVELFREFQFKSFRDAIRFMNEVAPGCDIVMHHPRWENIWKTIRVFLTTWDIGHQISDRDVQLARYFERAYNEYPGAATTVRK